MVSTNQPLLAYVSAASHSGSTLLAMLLNAHQDICSAGELKLGNLNDVDSYRCSCMEKVTKCSFWTEVSVEMKRRGFDFEIHRAATDLGVEASPYVKRLLKPLFRGEYAELARDTLLRFSPAWNKNLPAWKARNLALVCSIAQVAEGKVVVDSSKTGLRVKYLHAISELDIRLVRLIRDGRAVSLTYMDAANYADAKDPSLRGGGSGRSQHKNLTMRDAALEWRRSNEEANHLERLLRPENVIRVRYEDLCSDPRETLNSIVAFLGLETEYDFSQFRDAEHHVVGNGMRLDTTSEIRLDDRWKSALRRTDLDEFSRVAGALNELYGYDG